MHGVSLPQKSFDPRHQLRGRKAPRRPQRRVIILGNHDVGGGVNIQPELDHRRPVASLGAGSR